MSSIRSFPFKLSKKLDASSQNFCPELPEEMTRERKKKRHMRKMPPAAADTLKG